MNVISHNSFSRRITRKSDFRGVRIFSSSFKAVWKEDEGVGGAMAGRDVRVLFERVRGRARRVGVVRKVLTVVWVLWGTDSVARGSLVCVWNR